MKPQNEIEKIATRRIAKAIIEQAELEGWRKLKNEADVAAKVGQAVARHASQHGINPLFIKSSLMRLQDGRL
jgi:ribosomal protein L18